MGRGTGRLPRDPWDLREEPHRAAKSSLYPLSVGGSPPGPPVSPGKALSNSGVMEAPTVLLVGCEPLGAASGGPSPSWGAAGASSLPFLGPARRRGPQHT